MTIRTFKQQGLGYGSSPVTISAKINDAVVYAGTISTVNQPFPSFPNQDPVNDVDLYTWESTVDFSGTQTMEITVSGGTMLLTDTFANYVFTDNPTPPTPTMPGGNDVFDSFYSIQVGSQVIPDPLSNVTINGVAQSIDRQVNLDGQWYWKLNDGDVFACTVNIAPGFDLPSWDSSTDYGWGAWVDYQTNSYLSYVNSTGAPAGTEPTNGLFWLPVPAQTWDSAQSYQTQNVVQSAGIAYVAIQGVPPGTTLDNSTFWKRIYMGVTPV